MSEVPWLCVLSHPRAGNVVFAQFLPHPWVGRAHPWVGAPCMPVLGQAVGRLQPAKLANSIVTVTFWQFGTVCQISFLS